MGAFLEKPNTEKVLAKGEGGGIKYGVAAMQGWRMEMEDAHACHTSFKLSDSTEWNYFGVFDGHAGPKVSQYCSQNLLDCIKECVADSTKEVVTDETVKEGIRKGFLKLDEKLKLDPRWATGQDRSGTTAITVMISPHKIIWGNCGDSRGLLCRNGQLFFATVDHKPYNIVEKNRIEKAGGTVMMQRVNGSLAVSRALGDFDYKRSVELEATQQLVSPEPDLTVQDRDLKDQFLLLACDGVYDVMTNEEVVAYVLNQLQLKEDLSQICSDLIDLCLNKNSRDNMSVVLVTFPGAPQVSQEAIDQDRILQQQTREEIDKQLKQMVVQAKDPLELEDAHVVQELVALFNGRPEVISKHQYIVDKLTELRKEKFPAPSDEDFCLSDNPNPPPSFSNFGSGPGADDMETDAADSDRIPTWDSDGHFDVSKMEASNNKNLGEKSTKS